MVPFHTPLSPQQQHDFGIAKAQPLAMADQVRFSELDILGHVNNAVYMEWFERLRIRYTQDWGISSYDGGKDNPRIVIHSGTIQYRQELLMDEIYVCTARVSAFRTSSYSISQELWAGGTLRAIFDCVLVNLMPDGSGKMPLSDVVTARFVAVDGAAAD
ncbi:MAG: acyl-CoA thioesterase [Pseudomonadota bacterium]